ncbi:hypothetical protein JW935_13630 [candidate division KSB1 bacterium]|nr:hypothetical protein [candidate division KSB1 bacterium]
MKKYIVFAVITFLVLAIIGFTVMANEEKPKEKKSTCCESVKKAPSCCPEKSEAKAPGCCSGKSDKKADDKAKTSGTEKEKK